MNDNYGSGATLVSVVFGVFLAAKLFGAITWSWWWVFSPLWGPVALMLALMAVVGILWLLLLPFVWMYKAVNGD